MHRNEVRKKITDKFSFPYARDVFCQTKTLCAEKSSPPAPVFFMD